MWGFYVEKSMANILGIVENYLRDIMILRRCRRL
jgi:hypothetical protein